MKKVIKGIFILLFLLFLLIFVNKNNNYYESNTILTKEAIEAFEEDIKEGKQIIPSNYIQPKKEYNNGMSKLGLKSSKVIENIVNRILKKLLDSIETE